MMEGSKEGQCVKKGRSKRSERERMKKEGKNMKECNLDFGRRGKKEEQRTRKRLGGLQKDRRRKKMRELEGMKV